MMRTLRSSNFARASNASSSATISAALSPENVRCARKKNFCPATAAFVRRAFPRVVDQNRAHQRRRHAVKVPPALPLGEILFDQPQVSLIDKRGRLQRVIRALPAQIAVSQLTEFLVYDRH